MVKHLGHTLVIAFASCFMFMGQFCDPGEPECVYDPEYYCDLSAMGCEWDPAVQVQTAWLPTPDGGEANDCYETPGYGNCNRTFFNCEVLSSGSWECWYWDDAYGDWLSERFYDADHIDNSYVDYICGGTGDWTCHTTELVSGGWVNCTDENFVCQGADICN